MAKIDLDTFTPNSHKYHKETSSIEDKLEPVTNGARIREKTLRQKFADLFLGDEVGDVKSYLIGDVIIPAIKTMIVDVVENGIEMVFGVRRSGKGDKTHVPYASYYKSGSRNNNRDDSSDRNPRPDTRDIAFPSRGEAEAALDELCERITDYGKARVSNLKELAGLTGDFVDERWGWTNLRQAYVKRIMGGEYIIVLPKPEPIED